MAELDQYLTLGVADEIFAAPVAKVLEILDVPHISRLPRAPDNLLGMIDVRGTGVPVLDLRLTLGLPAVPDTENTRIVILQIEASAGPVTVGLRTDRVYDVTVLDRDTLDPAPAVASTRQGRFIAGIGRRNGAFVTVLDLDSLLGGETLAA